jgi:hypothetical protein
MKDKKFKVYTLNRIDNDSLSYVHWSKGLKMHIQKGDITIILEEDEIRKMVATLPRTIGGSY